MGQMPHEPRMAMALQDSGYCRWAQNCGPPRNVAAYWCNLKLAARRVRNGSGPQVLAGIRNSVIALVRRDGWTNIAAALRHYAIKTAAALRLIGITEN